MPCSNSIMAVIDAALDHNTDDEWLIDDIASHRRPRPGVFAEDRFWID